MHIAVILFGFTAILGDLIQLSAVMIVWWRVLLTSLSLLIFIRMGKTLLLLSKKDIILFLGIGFIVGLHWLCFYGSVKLANASVALVCLATTAFFTSLLEPILVGKKFNLFDSIVGALMVPGMALIFYNADSVMFNGIIVGLLAAFLMAVFAILNKINLHKSDFYSITFLEMIGAFMVTTIIIPFASDSSGQNHILPPSTQDWGYLILLVLACTTFAYVLSLSALKFISAFNSNLIANLEPFYGIIIAAIILKEYKELSLEFYLGSLLIILSVFIYPILHKRIIINK
jgi:drug/metabolite transporter (DMT)-like permease